MIEFAILFYLGYKNHSIAVSKGLNGWLWAGITILAFFLAEIIGAFFVLIFFLKNKVDFNLVATDPSYKDHAVDIINDEFKNNPMLLIAIYLFGVGGWLLVRYVLERKPDIHDDLMM
jgi:hypothetical protein